MTDQTVSVPPHVLEAIAHNLCSLHGFDVGFVRGQERFATAVITEYLRAAPSVDAPEMVQCSVCKGRGTVRVTGGPNGNASVKCPADCSGMVPAGVWEAYDRLNRRMIEVTTYGDEAEPQLPFITDLRAILSALQPVYAGAGPVARLKSGELHTLMMGLIREDIQRQHPDAFTEDTDCDLVIQAGPERPAYVKIDVSALAEAVLPHVSSQSEADRLERENEIVANAVCLFNAFVGGSAVRDVQNGTMTKAQADSWKAHTVRQHEESLCEMAGVAQPSAVKGEG